MPNNVTPGNMEWEYLAANPCETQIRIEHQIGRQEGIVFAASIDFQVRQRRQLEVAAIQPQRRFCEIARSAKCRVGSAQRLVRCYRPIVLAGADADIGGYPIVDIGFEADAGAQPETVAVLGSVQERRVRCCAVGVAGGVERAAVVDVVEVYELVVIVVVKEVAFVAHAQIAIQLEAFRPFRQAHPAGPSLPAAPDPSPAHAPRRRSACE